MGSLPTEVASPGVAAFIGFAAQVKPKGYEFARPFCRPVGAQSTAQPWHTELLGPLSLVAYGRKVDYDTTPFRKFSAS